MELDQCKDDVLDMEKELTHLRRDGHAKAMQANHLEMTLEQTLSELEKKAQQGKLLTILLWGNIVNILCKLH